MNQSCPPNKQKNWQWRVIIWSSLFIIFGKSLGNWAYNALGMDQAYTATAIVAKKAGIAEIMTTKVDTPIDSVISINIKNDTINDYTITTHNLADQVDFTGSTTFMAGSQQKIKLNPNSRAKNSTGSGDIVFTSAPMAGNNNSICQEIHTLNLDLKDTTQLKSPLFVNLSSIGSKIECKANQ